MVVDESGLDLDRPKESMIFNIAVIDVKCNEGFLRCDVAGANMRQCPVAEP